MSLADDVRYEIYAAGTPTPDETDPVVDRVAALEASHAEAVRLLRQVRHRLSFAAAPAVDDFLDRIDARANVPSHAPKEPTP